MSRPLRLGVVGRSSKENEHRLPIHPEHFDLIAPSLARQMWFESGYAEPFSIPDAELEKRFGGTSERGRLLAESDVVLLPKPMTEDLRAMREGGILWGWPHCVQQSEITQAAIDRRLTLVAWESMFLWKGEMRDMHVFYRNNEMAGYCAVIQAMDLDGRDGHYGPPLRARVLSHGSVSRGAVFALLGRGVREITIYTQRTPWAVHDKIPGCSYGQMVVDGDRILALEPDGVRRPLVEALAESDVIVNGILQDVDKPLMFLGEGDERRLTRGALIVDVSCDNGMGFPFARPTSFEQPTFRIGDATYYAVDHTPSYLWRSASWELSRVVVPFLGTIMGGPEAWERSETIRRAIEISDGVVVNLKVLSFQHRSAEYPHEREGR